MRLDNPIATPAWEACLLACRNRGQPSVVNRKTSALSRHSATYLFVPSPTELHARVIQPRR